MILAGDVGGTKTNLALYRREGAAFSRVRAATYPSREYPGLEAILRDFLAQAPAIERACVGVAGPVVSGQCRLTNLDWVVEEASLRRCSGAREAYLVNDLQAMASAVPFLPEPQAGSMSSCPVKQRKSSARSKAFARRAVSSIRSN